jgi:hypothetical protein
MAKIVSKDGMAAELEKKAKKTAKAIGGVIKAEYSGSGSFQSDLLNEILNTVAPNVKSKTIELMKTEGGWTIEEYTENEKTVYTLS